MGTTEAPRMPRLMVVTYSLRLSMMRMTRAIDRIVAIPKLSTLYVPMKMSWYLYFLYLSRIIAWMTEPTSPQKMTTAPNRLLFSEV